MRKLLFASVAAAALAFGAGLASAAQLSPAQLVVDDDYSTTNPAPDCIASGFATIQDAIDAANNGDSILVCPGTYNEDLVITKDDLSIAAYDRAHKSNTVIQGQAVSPGPFPNCGNAAGLGAPYYANINISARGVTITGFTIQSPAVAAGEYTCGVIVDGTNNTIYQNAFKVSCGAPLSMGIQTWYGPLGPKGAVDGLSIVGNSFSSSKLDSPDADCSYLGIYINPQNNTPSLNPVRIVRNTFSGKLSRGIDVSSRDWTDIKYNSLTTRLKPDGGLPAGIFVEGSVSNAVILGNEITSRKGDHHHRRGFATGIWLWPDTAGNVVKENVVKGSREFDCRDDSTDSGTAGTANLWEDNIGRKDSPDGICGRHDHDDD